MLKTNIKTFYIVIIEKKCTFRSEHKTKVNTFQFSKSVYDLS